MLDKSKTDSKLGKEVSDYLFDRGVQTPMTNYSLKSDKLKKELIQDKFNQIMGILGLDLSDDSLKETPKRISKMFVNELFWGLRSQNFPRCMVIDNKMNYDEMLIEKNIKCISACEHHFVIIFGKCHVAYIPGKKVIGLSKLNRVVEYFSRRPQVQERLTEQIFYALEYILQTSDIAVVIDGEHFCVKSRGVEDINSNTITSKLGGKFKSEPELRAEFMNLIK